ncbi:MAG: pirin family protein [Alphaproteobacteria bacterium]|nr:pirin family protein [Alphaproteobacteria bacterium]MBV9694443.1 pirin family protein [Alphaproteobacteria bacterium]
MIVLKGKAHDLGDGFFVNRILPQPGRRTIGPFVFLDQFGPAAFAPGRGIDVRPHPHIGLATVTYLFEGSQVHRDSLGTVQSIYPGDVNWMTAGRGIVHSERTGPDVRAHGHRMHGIQSWIGLPREDEETQPSFQNVRQADLPELNRDGVKLRLVVGKAFGLTSPVRVFSPIFYADARFAGGGKLEMTDEHDERAVLVIEGGVTVNGRPCVVGDMVVMEKGEAAALASDAPARAMLLGGAPLDGERHVWWNFVSSRQSRIEQAKDDWHAMRFGTIPGDDKEFIPLPPDRPAPAPQLE